MKILYITTISNTMNAFLVPHIRALVESGHQVDLAFNIVGDVKQELVDLGCKVYEVSFQRSPFSSQNLEAYKQLKNIIEKNKYDIVHTHTPVASFITRFVCRNIKNTKVMYTAHGFHFFKGVSFKNWLLYYPAELIASRYTDVLITINREDYERAKKHFKAKKVEYIHGIGINLEKFKNTEVSREEKLKSIGFDANDFVVLSAGELNDNKNHKTIIRAIDKLKDKSIKYIICGEGEIEEELKNLASELKLEDQVKLLGERKDLAEIYKSVDMLAFPSKREGLGMVSLEAMASGLPIVTSNVHGIVDYSVDGVTGFSCDPLDVDCFSKAIKKLKDDEELRATMGEHNKSAVDKFELELVLLEMKSIYKELIEEGSSYENS